MNKCNSILAILPEMLSSNSVLVHSEAYMTKYIKNNFKHKNDLLGNQKSDGLIVYNHISNHDNMNNISTEVSLRYTLLRPVQATQQPNHVVLASNEISSPAWAVYRLTEYAAATAGVLIGQLSPSGTRSLRPRLSNSSQFSTGPQLIRFPAIWEKRLRYSVSRERMLS
jgi:hypothetical protein